MFLRFVWQNSSSLDFKSHDKLNSIKLYQTFLYDMQLQGIFLIKTVSIQETDGDKNRSLYYSAAVFASCTYNSCSILIFFFQIGLKVMAN